jgi:hypothetical protein
MVLDILPTFLYFAGCAIAFGVLSYIFHTRIKYTWDDLDQGGWRLITIFATFGSWFSVGCALTYIIAANLAGHNPAGKRRGRISPVSIRGRIVRLLRIHAKEILDSVFVVAVVVATIVVYMANR